MAHDTSQGAARSGWEARVERWCVACGAALWLGAAVATASECARLCPFFLNLGARRLVLRTHCAAAVPGWSPPTPALRRCLLRERPGRRASWLPARVPSCTCLPLRAAPLARPRARPGRPHPGRCGPPDRRAAHPRASPLLAAPAHRRHALNHPPRACTPLRAPTLPRCPCAWASPARCGGASKARCV